MSDNLTLEIPENHNIFPPLRQEVILQFVTFALFHTDMVYFIYLFKMLDYMFMKT